MRVDRTVFSDRTRRMVRTLTATLTALIVVLLTAGVLTAGLARPAPEPAPVPAPQVDIGASSLVLVCPDPPSVVTDDGAGDIQYDAEFDTGPDDLATSLQGIVTGRDGSAPGQTDLTVAGATEGEGTTRAGSVVVDHPGIDDVAILRAQPAEGHTPLGAAVALSRADAGDLRGLSAASCQVPSSTQWLVGGTTEPGSSARLLVTNPGQTPVTARVEMWGAIGPVEDAAEVVLAPGESDSVLLETLALEERLAVRLTSEGGQVTAAIQDSALDGVVPAGTDMVTATTDPAQQTVVGPFEVTEAEAQADAPVLRVVNPAEEVTTVSVELLTAEGSRGLAGAEEQELEPGTVTDISLAGVEPGPLAVRIEADHPVTGAVQRSIVGEPGELDPGRPVVDRAWLPAQRGTERGVLPLPTALVDAHRVLLANPTAQSQQVILEPIGTDGARLDAVPMDVAPHSTVMLTGEDLPSDALAVDVTGTEVHATTMAHAHAGDGTMLAMIGLTPDAEIAQQVQVRPGRY